MINRLVRLCAVVALAIAIPASGVRALSFDSDFLVVGITPTRIQTDESPRSEQGADIARRNNLLAITIDNVLSDYIDRGLVDSLDRPGSVVDVPNYSLSQPTGEPLSAVVEPTIAVSGSLGIRISAKLKAKAGPSDVEAEEVLLLPPTADYGDVDVKMSDFGLRIAKRLASLSLGRGQSAQSAPRGIARFYCVQALDPGDQKLQLLSHRLTIELPDYLAEASRRHNLDLMIRGLDIREALVSCDTFHYSWGGAVPDNTKALSNRIEAFSWDGTIEANPRQPGAALLTVGMSDKSRGTNYRRIGQITVSDPLAPNMAEIADQIVTKFADQYRVR